MMEAASSTARFGRRRSMTSNLAASCMAARQFRKIVRLSVVPLLKHALQQVQIGLDLDGAQEIAAHALDAPGHAKRLQIRLCRLDRVRPIEQDALHVRVRSHHGCEQAAAAADIGDGPHARDIQRFED